MSFVITGSCCNDATCVSVCPVNCIHPTPDEADFGRVEMLYIDPDTCISCGACALVCPAEAIAPAWTVPPDAEPYRAVNARYFANPAHRGYTSQPVRPDVPSAQAGDLTGDPLRVAIVGSGPSAAYTAEALCEALGPAVEVNMFERLPVPWGLARFGIAPDHPSTKAVIQLFERTARRPNVQLYLNVEVGTAISHDDLLDHHHGVIYAVGAAHDRRLDIPGEQLPGSVSATDFAAWYNGHPDMADAHFDFSSERAVIVGNGNVAMDVARLLVSDIDHLAKTDMADGALEALAESRITEVVVVGRRGPAQAAYTLAELIGLTQLPNAEVVAVPDETSLDSATQLRLDNNPHDMAHLKVDLTQHVRSTTAPRLTDKRIVLRYGVSPVEILGSSTAIAVRLVHNDLGVDRSGEIVAVPSSRFEVLECGLILRAVGHRSTPLPGLPFDEGRLRLPTQQGRIVEAVTGIPVPGAYATGWVKRGASGYLGSNRHDAQETVQALIADFAAAKLQAPKGARADLQAFVRARQPSVLETGDWQAIDAHERDAAAGGPRPRVKLTAIADLLEVAHEAKEQPRHDLVRHRQEPIEG